MLPIAKLASKIFPGILGHVICFSLLWQLLYFSYISGESILQLSQLAVWVLRFLKPPSLWREAPLLSSRTLVVDFVVITICTICPRVARFWGQGKKKIAELLFASSMLPVTTKICRTSNATTSIECVKKTVLNDKNMSRSTPSPCKNR